MSEITDHGIDPRIQRQVWRGLGTRPLKQIAEETGLDRDQIIRIREELLSSVDDLTIQQKRQKLLVELESLAYEARDRAQGMPDEFYSGAINSSVSAIKAVQAELARMAKADDGKIEALNQMRIRELLRLIDTTVAHTLEEISQEHDLPVEELQAIFTKHLRPAAQELEGEAE